MKISEGLLRKFGHPLQFYNFIPINYTFIPHHESITLSFQFTKSHFKNFEKFQSSIKSISKMQIFKIVLGKFPSKISKVLGKWKFPFFNFPNNPWQIAPLYTPIPFLHNITHNSLQFQSWTQNTTLTQSTHSFIQIHPTFTHTFYTLFYIY